MQLHLLNYLRCPITKSKLLLTIIKEDDKLLDGELRKVITEGILTSEQHCIYPIINGVPRLTVEAVIDYDEFLQKYVPLFAEKKIEIIKRYGNIIELAIDKNLKSKRSFSKEWSIFNPDTDKTWDADEAGMLQRFCAETGENIEALKTKLIFDAGCGNGFLNSILAKNGLVNIGMDFSSSIETAYAKNQFGNAHYIQGDVQFPPVCFKAFDLVHSSGVLHHTNNTELSFSCIEPLVKPNGKISIWLYKPRKNFIHQLFNQIRKVTSLLPLSIQYILYCITIFPISYVVKKIKGNKQNVREMMIDILDWFSPEFRWEHTEEEVTTWLCKRNFTQIQITTTELFGFNITGIKNAE